MIGEESGNYATMQVFDPSTKTLYAAPDLGYGGWESATQLDTGTRNKVAILLGDDNSAAPIYLYVGTKETRSGDVLKRNGL
ncbi:MAG: PEP-CTERM sorting domain-containing protein, partial [Synechococcaceae bacterium WB9_2_170]|nr:PEP-CTERM sorting domain-containing protein [Synechococcaceae bacterium WB9_2_170]